MGKPTGFMDYTRVSNHDVPAEVRVHNFEELHKPLPAKERREQAARCMDCGVPFCQSSYGCPLSNLIPEWNDLLYRGQFESAARRLLATNNFPEFTSRVCPALCEHACICNLHGDPVATRDNENFIIEYAFAEGLMQPRIPAQRSDKKIAVIGSGPAGLAAADQLGRRGHHVTVFERSDRVGGLLMYGIPNMKLDKSVIERRIRLMEAEGIVFRTNTDVGKAEDAAALLQEFDAVILACGASQPRDLKVPGREASGVHFAVEYLTASTKAVLSGDPQASTISAKGKHVVIVGGGDTGNDCVGTAIRQGAKSVTQLEMMPKLPDTRAENNPYPEYPRVCKTDYGQEEAIAVFGSDPRLYETTIKELLRNDKGVLTGVKLAHVSFGANRELLLGEESEREADLVLIAAGFLGTEAYVAEAFGTPLTARTNVETLPGTHQTTNPKIFTAGDMRTGQSLVVRAIADGRAAAREVDAFLMGYTNLI